MMYYNSAYTADTQSLRYAGHVKVAALMLGSETETEEPCQDMAADVALWPVLYTTNTTRDAGVRNAVDMSGDVVVDAMRTEPRGKYGEKCAKPCSA